MDSFFYFIEDSESNALALKQIRYAFPSPTPTQQEKELELQRILMTEKLLQLPYAQVYICYSSTNFTLVPDELFYKHEIDTYLRQVTRVDDTQTVGSFQINKLNLNLVYSVDKVVQDVVKSYFPGSKHLHIVAPLVMQSYQQCQSRVGEVVCLHIGNGIMGAVLLDGADLKLVNTYPYQTEMDFMYHTLMIYEQFGLNPKEVPVLISGRTSKKTSIYDQLSKYINKLEIIKPPSYYQYSSVFENVDFHFYQDLLSMKLCV